SRAASPGCPGRIRSRPAVSTGRAAGAGLTWASLPVPGWSPAAVIWRPLLPGFITIWRTPRLAHASPWTPAGARLPLATETKRRFIAAGPSTSEDDRYDRCSHAGHPVG